MKNDLHCNSQSDGQHMKIYLIYEHFYVVDIPQFSIIGIATNNFSLISIVFLVRLRSHCSTPHHYPQPCSRLLLLSEHFCLLDTMDFMLYNINIAVMVRAESEEVWKKKLKRKTKVQGQEIEFLMLFSLAFMFYVLLFLFFHSFARFTFFFVISLSPQLCNKLAQLIVVQIEWMDGIDGEEGKKSFLPSSRRKNISTLAAIVCWVEFFSVLSSDRILCSAHTHSRELKYEEK